MLVRVTIEIWKEYAFWSLICCIWGWEGRKCLMCMSDLAFSSPGQQQWTSLWTSLPLLPHLRSWLPRAMLPMVTFPWSSDEPGVSCTNTTAHTETQSDGGMCGITWCTVNAFGGVVLCILLWRNRSLRPDRKWGNIWDGLRECDEAPKWKSCRVGTQADLELQFWDIM